MSVRRAVVAEIAAGALVVLALGLRLWRIDFGLPAHYHPDEPIKSRRIVRIAAGERNPGNFYHPSFMLYAGAAALKSARRAGWAKAAGDQDAIRIGRRVNAFLGAATVGLTFLAARSLAGRWAALGAAVLLAVSPLHVTCSRYLKEDIPMTFWAVAVFLAAVLAATRGRRRDLLLSGFLAGVCTGTKYPGALMLLLPWLAHRERRALGQTDGAGQPRALRLAAAAAVVGFLAVTPYAVLDLPHFLAGAGYEGGNVFTGLAGIAVPARETLWTFHLRRSIGPGLGWPATGLALLGIVLLLRQRSAAARLISVPMFAFWALFETSPYKPPPNFDRYVVPLLPFLCVAAAVALDLGWRKAQRFRPRRRWAARAVVLAIALGAIAVPARETVRLGRFLLPDTRDAAGEWLARYACGNGRILLEGALWDGVRVVPSYVPELPARCRAEYTYSLYRRKEELRRFDFLVASSFMYERFFLLPTAPQPLRDFYADLFRRAEPVAVFRPVYRSYGFHNPTIVVMRPPRP